MKTIANLHIPFQSLNEKLKRKLLLLVYPINPNNGEVILDNLSHIDWEREENKFPIIGKYRLNGMSHSIQLDFDYVKGFVLIPEIKPPSINEEDFLNEFKKIMDKGITIIESGKKYTSKDMNSFAKWCINRFANLNIELRDTDYLKIWGEEPVRD